MTLFIKAGRFRNETVYAPFDHLHPIDIHESVQSMIDSSVGFDCTIHTRNPYVLDEFPAAQCLIVGPSGKIKRLLDHPQAKLIGELSTGEFWSSVGEEWCDA